MTSTQREGFLSKLRISGSINFPRIGMELNIPWSDLEPELSRETPLRRQVQEFVDNLRYELADAMLQAARSGRKVDTGSAKAMIAMIEEGLVLPSGGTAANDDIQAMVRAALADSVKPKTPAL